MGNLVTQVKKFVIDFFVFWNKPPKGRYLPNKEATAYCIGGMGVVGASVIPTFVTVGAGMYIAVALHMTADEIIMIGLINTLFGLAKSPFIGWLLDNVRSKKYGKFHPYMIWMPIPVVASAFALGWVPYLLLDVSHIYMLISYIVIFNLLQLFMGLYGTGFTMTVQVISPSPTERTWLMSVGAFVYSLGPSIVNALLPLAANLLFSKKGIGSNGEPIVLAGVNDIRTSQWIIPIMFIVFCGLGYLVALFTKERTVVPKEYKQKINFVDGFKQTLTNKYFWITNISAILAVFRMAMAGFVGWICTYIYQNAWSQALFVSIIGFANVPGMLLAPLLIKKFGNRNLIIISNILTLLLTIPMLFSLNMPLLLLMLIFLITMVNGVQVVTGPVMNSQLYDYQQYKTGKRLEGFLSQIGGVLGTVGGLMTVYVQPFVCKMFGYVDDATVLYNPDVLQPIMRTMFVIAMISAGLSIIPILFWNITEKRHQQIMDILRVRADYKDGLIDTSKATELEQSLEAGDRSVMSYRGAFEEVEKSAEM